MAGGLIDTSPIFLGKLNPREPIKRPPHKNFASIFPNAADAINDVG